MSCTCPPLKDLMAAGVNGQDLRCQMHTPTPHGDVEPLALNDFDGLRSAIDRALGTTTTSTTEGA